MRDEIESKMNKDENGEEKKYKNCEDKLKEIECRQQTYTDGEEQKNFKS